MRAHPTTAAPLRVRPVCGSPGRRPADLSRGLRAGRAGRSGRRRRRSRDGIRGRACDDWTCSQCAPGRRRLTSQAGRCAWRGAIAADLLQQSDRLAASGKATARSGRTAPTNAEPQRQSGPGFSGRSSRSRNRWVACWPAQSRGSTEGAPSATTGQRNCTRNSMLAQSGWQWKSASNQSIQPVRQSDSESARGEKPAPVRREPCCYRRWRRVPCRGGRVSVICRTSCWKQAREARAGRHAPAIPVTVLSA